jgi:hypothetical protein
VDQEFLKSAPLIVSVFSLYCSFCKTLWTFNNIHPKSPFLYHLQPSLLRPRCTGEALQNTDSLQPLHTRSRSERPSIFNMNHQQEQDLLGVGAQFNNNDASAVMAHHQAFVHEWACRKDQADLLNSDQDMHPSDPRAGRHGNTSEH